MFFTRRFNALLQCSKGSRPDLRRARSLGLALGLSAGLAACGAPSEEGEEAAAAEPQIREIPVTAAFQETDSAASSLVFIREPEAAWQGRVVAAARGGGLDVYDIDGARLTQASGPRLSSLAAAPGFQLRGADLPLIFGVETGQGGVRAYGFVRSSDDVLDLPIADIEMEGGAAALCLYREGVGFVELVVLGVGARAEIWRIQDDGGDIVSAQRQTALPLPSPARDCDVQPNGDLILASPSGGLYRVSPDGVVLAESLLVAENIAAGDFLGRRLVLVSADGRPELAIHDAATLEPLAPVALVQALSTPGVERPGAIAVTSDSFGSTYTSGVVALVDREDGRIKVIARDTFARAVIQAAVEDSEDS